MNEDVTRRLPDRPDGLEELIRLVQALRSELTELKQTVEARLHDTRPIWEKVQADIAQLQEGQQRLEAGQKRLEEKLEALRDDTRTGLRNLKRDFGILNDTFLEVRGEYRDLDRRVYRLEEPQP
jgi:predicted  nucleic acid-binding Zn-ribbon protein